MNPINATTSAQPNVKKLKKVAGNILAQADICIDGDRAWDIQVLNGAFYAKVLSEGSLGLGETYMNGWWECDALDELFFRLLRSGVTERKLHWKAALLAVSCRCFNRQSQRRSFDIGEAHYDKGNDLFRMMLDKRMAYSCGYWKDATTLDDAQEAKLELICAKLNLQPGMKILDIGCGWGSFAKYAAEKHGATVTGITVSKEQAELARTLCNGLPVEIRLQDYRDVKEIFDRVVSVGMFEHVGYKNYRTYMEVVHRCLRDDGLFLLHTIGNNTSSFAIDPWIEKYIFPRGMLPSIKQIGAAMEDVLVMEDWHSFGADYDKTLMAWHENFMNAWPQLQNHYDERFYRMWRYYLLSCAGLFRSRQCQLWQIVASKKGLIGGYRSLR